MPLNVRSIAVSAAVFSFFAVGLIGWCTGLMPFTCCKRALTGAVVVYIAVTLIVRAVNAILTNAMIESQLRKLKEEANDNRD
jgi:hypothetical protein